MSAIYIGETRRKPAARFSASPLHGYGRYNMSIARIAALGAIAMVCCGQQAPPAPPASHGGLLGLFTGDSRRHSLAAGGNPAIAARENFEWAIDDYKMPDDKVRERLRGRASYYGCCSGRCGQ